MRDYNSCLLVSVVMETLLKSLPPPPLLSLSNAILFSDPHYVQAPVYGHSVPVKNCNTGTALITRPQLAMTKSDFAELDEHSEPLLLPHC